jgi:hypothetical protein
MTGVIGAGNVFPVRYPCVDRHEYLFSFGRAPR